MISSGGIAMKKRDNTAKDLCTITYIILFIAAAVTAITGGEGSTTYLCIGLAFMGSAECLDTKPGRKERKRLRAERK